MALPPLSTLKPSFDSKDSNIRQTFALIRTSGMDRLGIWLARSSRSNGYTFFASAETILPIAFVNHCYL
jgi:hypothetical protein